jgi:glycosyltransferase involved in cell wall biosynthesis|tara:strand:+ start:6599 stop:7762 length:1164 start_codon:yes stop_codon:yes gene_type:complete
MKKIKVYLQYPWNVSDSQYYKSMIKNPPEEIEYLPKNQKAGTIINKKRLIINNLKENLRRFIEFFDLPIVNSHNTNYFGDFDIIHYAHCLSKENTGKPWIADFESVWQMWISGRDTKIGRKRVKKILGNKNCKKVLAWTDSAKDEIIKIFPEIKDKVEVVGFGQPIQKFKKIKKKNISLLFIGRYFEWKGGVHAVEAMDKLTKKYENVDAIVISKTPKKILKKYSNNKKIKFFELISHEKLIKEIFPSSDIMIYPGYSDTFGFIFPESLSFGIPVVTIDGVARKDLIEDKKTGIVIESKKRPGFEEICLSKSKIVDKLIEKRPSFEEICSSKSKIVDKLIEETSKLIENKKLREKMSKNCLMEVKNGRFSIEEKNKKLRKIYEEGLK